MSNSKITEKESELRPGHLMKGPGPNFVGFRAIQQHDPSRTIGGKVDALGHPVLRQSARPVQTLIWYPASTPGERVMTLGAYSDLSTYESGVESGGLPEFILDWRRGSGCKLDMSFWATENAPEALGTYPTVIYAASGFGAAWENADLCEFIASHGYVVIASPLVGPATHNAPYDRAAAIDQARDISFLVGFAQTLPNIDREKVAVLGASWGGISNVFAAASDARIKALICLDGSVRYYPNIIEADPDIEPSQIQVPLLYFAQRVYSLETHDHFETVETRAAPSVLNRWTGADLINVHMFGLTHGLFVSAVQRDDDFWWQLENIYPAYQADYSRAEAQLGYQWVGQYILKFLSGYLDGDDEALAFLKQRPAQNGVPPHTMAVEFRSATARFLALDGFKTQVGKDGFDRAKEIYQSLQTRDSKFSLAEHELMAWAADLFGLGNSAAAIKILEFLIFIRPDSVLANERLGDALRRLNDFSGATSAYAAALDGVARGQAPGRHRRLTEKLANAKIKAK